MLSIETTTVSRSAFVKDPFTTNLGQRIVVDGTRLLKDIGFEVFTFKKLAQHIDSTEASIYRYFTNKHMFLVFLSNLYWTWLKEHIHQLAFNGQTHSERLEKAIRLIASGVPKNENDHFPLNDLIEVITSEGPKVYLTKWVDQENTEGVFHAYKSLCDVIAQLILNVNPEYRHAHSLASIVVESAHNQLFFSRHLPRLTDIDSNDVNQLHQFLVHTVTSAIS